MILHVDVPLRDSILSASQRPDVLAAVSSLYADVQKEIDARRPLCSVSGRCCRFEDFGHRLYVTTLELAAFLADFQSQPRLNPLATWDQSGCPFQISKLCTAHPFRPFGCRIFFCDATATDWQQSQYEIFHTRLKHLHESLQVPYFYVEWRSALQTLFEPTT